jgi:N,N-dimethylformamidase beta subunit-like, C-terminal
MITTSKKTIIAMLVTLLVLSIGLANTSIKVNGKALYATAASARSTNKLITATVLPSTTPSSKALQSVTRSSSSTLIVKIKAGNSNNLTKGHSFLLDTNLHHNNPSKGKSTITSTFKNAVHNTAKFDRKINIAFIKPSFTAAAYDNSFYDFYTLYKDTPAGKSVATNLNLLTSKVTTLTTDSSSSALAMLYLSKNIKSLLPGSNTVILTDADVDGGNIFTAKNKSNKYDILIIGHQEYVTQQEYDNLKQFVAGGGTMIVLDGNIFYAEVKYDRNTQTVTLVKGHGWSFNGMYALKSVAERWKDETSQWVGSNYLCYRCGITFDNDPFEYKQHEEQYITNHKDRILFNYNALMPKQLKLSSAQPSSSLSSTTTTTAAEQGKHIIATYELSYRKGKVIVIGIYSDDIITNSKFDKYFYTLLLRYALRIR